MLSIVQRKDHDDIAEVQLPFASVRILGHGHSGTVEKSRAQNTNQIYARKMLRTSGSKMKRAERTKVFWIEVKIIRSLENNHHIVGVHATYVTKRDFGMLL